MPMLKVNARRLSFLIAPSAFALAVLLAGAFLAEAKRPRQAPDGGGAAPAIPATAPQCKKDKDCVAVPDDCCSCNEGGKQRALPSAQKDAYETNRQKRCAGTMCPQMISRDPSCAQRAVCIGGTCKLNAGPAPLAPAP